MGLGVHPCFCLGYCNGSGYFSVGPGVVRYLKSVFTLDVTWFDLNEAAGLAAKLEGDIAAVHSFMSAGLGRPPQVCLGRGWGGGGLLG